MNQLETSPGRSGSVALPSWRTEVAIIEPERVEHPSDVKTHTPTIRLLLNLSCAVALSAIAVDTWALGLWPVCVICWIVGGHFMHTFALSFHDAAHGTLHPNHRINEFLASLYGTMILVPLTVYRRAHAQHHARLASIDDPELYPFVDPKATRGFRLTCAMAEILFGYIYTPLLFLRSFLTDRKATADERRRILREYAVIAVMLVLVLATVGLTGTWRIYLTGILAPVMIGGLYQTINKYTEHLGLFGSTILESTRSILPKDRWNGAISSLLQHVDHHGTHHMRARIPYFELPAASEQVYCERPNNLPLYHSYAAAAWSMLLTLHDPKAGPQWNPQPSHEPLIETGVTQCNRQLVVQMQGE